MSRIPSNTEQFLSGLAAGNQNIGQAAQNFAIKEQAAQGRMGLQLEQEKMRQQGAQFERGLQAEAENYRNLNASRERMQARELEQQGAQFERRMGFDEEQARLERLLAVRLKQHEMEQIALNQEIAATASNDPRILELRARRKDLKAKGRELEQMIASAGQAQQLAQGVKTDRLQEAQARLTAMKEGLQTQSDSAREAVLQGFQFSTVENALDEGYLSDIARLTARGEVPAYGTAAAAGVSPLFLLPGMEQTGATMAVLLDSLATSIFGDGAADRNMAFNSATEFARNGGAMAATTLANAVSLNKEAFGLDAGNAAKAQQVLTEVVAEAAILANLNPNVGPRGQEAQKYRREQIAKGLGQLREAGMSDVQITALLDALDSMSSSRAELMAQYTAQEAKDNNQVRMMNNSLEGVGKVSDIIQGVADDSTFMSPVGGVIKDNSKYDWIGTLRRAQAAYGMGESSEQIVELQRSLQGLDVSPEELTGLVEALTSADPNLQYLRPQDYVDVLRGMQQRGGTLEDLAQEVQDLLGQTQAEVVSGQQAQATRQGIGRLEQLLGEIGG